MQSVESVRAEALAASARHDRAARRWLARLRHPQSVKDQQAVLRRIRPGELHHGGAYRRPTGELLMQLTADEEERVRLVLKLSWLTFARGPWGGPPKRLTARIRRLCYRARRSLNQGRWDEARRYWQEADALDSLEHDHEVEKDRAALRELAEERADARRNLNQANLEREAERKLLEDEFLRIARSRPRRDIGSKIALARAVRAALLHKHGKAPTVRTIRRYLPALREL